jgi:hypothetical protein
LIPVPDKKPTSNIGFSDGFFRPVIKEVVERYLDCGNPRSGFARIRCPDCHAEHLLTLAAEKPPPVRVFEPVALMAAEESGDYE